MTVSPRPVQPRRNVKPLALGAAVAGVAALAGLLFWLARPSEDNVQPAGPEEPTTTSGPQPTATSEDDARLLRLLPKGYRAGACEPTQAPEGVLSQVKCAQNDDPDGPVSATFSLVGDTMGLEKVFNETISAANRVDCPGNIQSPGPWRRNATPDSVSGQLYCGLVDGQPTVVWTDEERKTVSAVRAGPDGPTFPRLYAWWSSHS
ncbi:hypothetical protein A5790_04385 [Mycobacterium sp. 852002-51152_SCH6134967]|nr:hypothetical protein A5790_04385 [Mycobacterium sp. 852002-51152_SCH6134967]